MSVLRRLGAAVLCGMVLAACSGPEQKLVGAWESTEGGRLNHLDLRADGSLAGTLHRLDFAGNKIPAGQYAGSWQFKRGRLNLLITQSDVVGLAPGYTSSDEIVELSDQVLSVRLVTGHEESWQRVP